MTKGQNNPGDVAGGDPAFRNQGLAPRIVVEQVEGLVDELLPVNSILPALQRVRNLGQLGLSRRFGIVQDMSDILQSCVNLPQGVVALVGISVDRVQRGTHRFSDLADLGKKLLAMGEDDEDVLADFGSSGWVDEDLLDVGVVHIKVATQDTPEDSFKGRNTTAVDGTSYEPKWGEWVTSVTYRRRDATTPKKKAYSKSNWTVPSLACVWLSASPASKG